MTEYRLVPRTPSIAEYRDLRRLSGLSEKSLTAAERGLPATLFAVVIEVDGQAIGMGRVIGDGGTAYQLVDIAVLPAHQGQGLGKRIVAALVEWLHAQRPELRLCQPDRRRPRQGPLRPVRLQADRPASIGMAFKIASQLHRHIPMNASTSARTRPIYAGNRLRLPLPGLRKVLP